MNRQHIDLVRSSFALVQPIAPTAAAMFYENLFTADPALRALFKGNMNHQGERLMTAIGAALRLLERPGELTSMLRLLGTRHAGYGVREAHYDSVGAALLLTLQQGLGDAFTLQTRAAWTELFGVIRNTMLEGARAVAPVAAS